jgi:NADH:ubiquinone reductase (H+-translocating)
VGQRRAGQKKRGVVVGAGFGGAYAAKKLEKSLPHDYEVTVIDRNNFLLFYPLLIEAGVGNLEPRHVVVPIRKFLKRAEFVMGDVIAIDTDAQQITYRVLSGTDEAHLHCDHLVLGPGSVTRLPDIPGLKEFGFEIKSLADAIGMRDRAIQLLELANTLPDPATQRELLRIVVVGSNFTGIEFAGEFQAFLEESAKSYRNLRKDLIEVVVVEFADRILPALDADLAEFARKHLEGRGLKIRTKTSVQSMTDRSATLTNGEELATRTVVWAAGISPSPLLDRVTPIARDKKGYLVCESDLRVQGMTNVWGLGDCAFVPAPDGTPYAATAQNATRQGTVAADNIVRSIKGEPTRPFKFKPLGSLAALGCRTAVAKVIGVKVSGFLAYFLYRVTYLGKMPTLSRKARVLIDWVLDIFFRQDPVQLSLRGPLEKRP